MVPEVDFIPDPVPIEMDQTLNQVIILDTIKDSPSAFHNKMNLEDVVIIDVDGDEEDKQHRTGDTSQQEKCSLEYMRKNSKRRIEFEQYVVENEEPKKPDKKETTPAKTPTLQLMPAPPYAVLTGQLNPPGYVVPPDRYSILQQVSDSSPTPPKPRRRLIDLSDGSPTPPKPRRRRLIDLTGDSPTPPNPKRRRLIDSADILSGVRPRAPANRVCEEVDEYRPLYFKHLDQAKNMMDEILKGREKYKE